MKTSRAERGRSTPCRGGGGDPPPLAIVNRGETPLDRLAFFRADDLAAFAAAALAFAAAR